MGGWEIFKVSSNNWQRSVSLITEEFQCNIGGYCYVSNDNITHANLFKDDLHLLDTGKQILADNFIFNVNRKFLMSRTFHPNVHLIAV